jgi:hypothetical protein
MMTSDKTPAPSDIDEMIERSSLGTPEARAQRATVSDEKAAELVAEANRRAEPQGEPAIAAVLRDAQAAGNNRPRTGSGIPPAPPSPDMTGNRAGNSAADPTTGATSWTASNLLEDLGRAATRAEYFQTGEEGLLRRTAITIQNLLHHGHLEAEVRLIIRDLDTARAAGTVITYGHIQRRLQEALERSES